MVKPDYSRPSETKTPQQIYITNHGWHTGIVLPAETIQKKLPQLSQRFGQTPYLEFGWGDKGFYQASEITTGLTIQAIFWPTESVMHVVAVTNQPPIYFPNSQVEALCISSEGWDALNQFISNSFAKNYAGELIEQKNGLYGDSQFYQAVGDYYLMNTCNKWTAKGLQSAGFDISPVFKLTAGSVMNAVNHSRTLQIKTGCTK